MAHAVRQSSLSAQSAKEDRIGDLLLKKTIDKDLAAFRPAASLLASNTLRDFLKSYPGYEIRDGRLPPFFKRAQFPGLECLIACINVQWARHYLQTGTESTEEIPSIGPASVQIWRDQVPELLNLLFLENPNAFLNADIYLQQTIVLMTQDFLETLFPKFPLPNQFYALVRELEVPDMPGMDAALIVLAQQKLDRVQKKT